MMFDSGSAKAWIYSYKGCHETFSSNPEAGCPSRPRFKEDESKTYVLQRYNNGSLLDESISYALGRVEGNVASDTYCF